MSLAGSFLVARSSLRDPNFARTVILLMAHNEDGAFGLVVNRVSGTEGLPWPLFVGGPCPSPGLLMLHGQPEWLKPPAETDEEETQEVAPGIFAGDAASLQAASQAEDGSCRYRVFSGYSGWSEGQLESELAEGAWAVAPATPELLFDTPADELWEQLAPPRLPQPSIN
jgi:putative transcriptional regulator